MKKIGSVSIITHKGDLLVQTTKAHRLGAKVVNSKIKAIGKIVDVIGPAAKPYIVINTRNAEAQAKEGEDLYIIDEKKMKKKTPGQRTKKSYPPKKKKA